MIQSEKNKIKFFDDGFKPEEQFPKEFTLSFTEVGENNKNELRVVLNNERQLGDVINDNSYTNDFYRYHDIFHYTFATLLGWSPCARAMMKRKRKSNELFDRIEDGARAIITEEALSMVIFNEAKRKNFFENSSNISKTTLRIIKEMTGDFEVSIRSTKEWEFAILKGYEIFRLLTKNNGGIVNFNAINKEINYSLN